MTIIGVTRHNRENISVFDSVRDAQKHVQKGLGDVAIGVECTAVSDNPLTGGWAATFYYTHVRKTERGTLFRPKQATIKQIHV